LSEDPTRESVDPAAVLDELGVQPVSPPIPILGGADNQVWRVEDRSRPYALRVFQPDREEVWAREQRAIAVAGAASIPVPTVVRSGRYRDRAVLLHEWLPGLPIGRYLRRRPWEAYSVGRLFGQMQRVIHAIRVGPELPPPTVDRYESLLGGELLAGVQSDTAAADRLIHLDYHALNVMTDGRRITGVLDWTNARRGDPRLDYARTLTIVRLDCGQIGRPWLSSLPTVVVSRVFEAGWRAGYGRDAFPSGMAPFHALAGAIMLRDLGTRYPKEDLRHVARWSRRWAERFRSTH